MSEGIRLGVNRMRLKSSDSDCASELTRSVLASPGTPTSRACPREKIAIIISSSTGSMPTIAFRISARIKSRASPRRATACSSSAEMACFLSVSVTLSSPFGVGITL